MRAWQNKEAHTSYKHLPSASDSRHIPLPKSHQPQTASPHYRQPFDEWLPIEFFKVALQLLDQYHPSI